MAFALNIIAKESGKMARLMVSAFAYSIKDIFEQVVFVDNGCDEGVRDVFNTIAKEDSANWIFKDAKGKCDFSNLRNMALDISKQAKMDWVAWQDCDDIVNRNDYLAIKNGITTDKKINKVIWRFHHFMGCPFLIQIEKMYHIKCNMFRVSDKTKWEKGVHECPIGIPPGNAAQLNEGYLHFGYALKPAYFIMLKWLHYEMIEKGNVNHYVDNAKKGEAWMRDGNPQRILEHRFEDKSKIMPYPGIYPPSFYPILQLYSETEKKIELYNYEKLVDSYQNWMLKYDNDSFWTQWQEKAKTVGNWWDTYEWAVTEYMNKGQ